MFAEVLFDQTPRIVKNKMLDSIQLRLRQLDYERYLGLLVVLTARTLGKHWVFYCTVSAFITSICNIVLVSISSVEPPLEKMVPNQIKRKSKLEKKTSSWHKQSQ